MNFLFFYITLLNYIEFGLYSWIPPANILEHEVILKSEALDDRSKEPGFPVPPALHCFCHTSSVGRKVNLTCLSACYYTPSNPKHSDPGIFLAFPDSNKFSSFSHNYNNLNNATWLLVIVTCRLEMLKSGGNACLRMNRAGIWSFRFIVSP